MRCHKKKGKKIPLDSKERIVDACVGHGRREAFGSAMGRFPGRCRRIVHGGLPCGRIGNAIGSRLKPLGACLACAYKYVALVSGEVTKAAWRGGASVALVMPCAWRVDVPC